MSQEYTEKKVFIRTLGCQMNESDSEVLAGVLQRAGYCLVPEEAGADVLLVNTCSVRGSAEQKVWSLLGVWGRRKRLKPGLLIGVVGCMAQIHQAALAKRMPFIDIICGPSQIRRVPELIEQVLASRRRVLEVEDSGEFSLKAVPIVRSSPVKAYVTIMRGCDKECTYCIVPQARGSEISRGPAEILQEIRDLAAHGYKEVTLLGQNVNSYGKGLAGMGVDFVDLLRQASGVRGIERIRFVTSHPMDISDKLIDAFGALPKLCEYLHFPLQSGSDRILKRMKRHYTRARYMEIVKKLRAVRPGIALSTDIIVGFPGETSEDFEQTRRALEEIRFDMAFLFKYSARKGTPAEKLQDDVPRTEKERRHAELLNMQNEIMRINNEMWVGGNVEVLVEGPSDGNPDRWAGRTRENRLAVFPRGDARPGDIVTLRVEETTAFTLRCAPRAFKELVS